MSAEIINIALVDSDTIHSVTMRLSLPELVFLAQLIGRMNSIQANEVMPHGAEISHEIYNALASTLNRFYEDGVQDALRSLTDSS